MPASFAHKLWVSMVIGVLFCLSVTAQSLEKLEAIASRATSLDDFLAKPKLVEEYRRALVAYQHREKFRCETFDRILAKIRLLKERVPGFKERLWQKENLATISVQAFPGENDSLAAHGAKTTYQFRPVARRFHAIFNDPSNMACLSDSCGKNDPTSPERWAGALKDAQVYFVERDGIFMEQSILVTPIARDRQIYPLISVSGGPALQRPIDLWSQKLHRKDKIPLLSVWMARARESFPKNWNHFVVLKRQGEAAVIERLIAAGVLKREDRVLGTPMEFEPADGMARQIEAAIPRHCGYAKGESLGSNFLGLAQAETKPAKGVVADLKGPLNPGDPEAMKKALEGVKYGNAGALASLRPDQIPAAEKTLSDIFRNDPTASNRARAGLALNSLEDMRQKFNVPTSVELGRGAMSVPSGFSAKELWRQGLADPSPEVRGIAALGAVNSGQKDRALAAPMRELLNANEKPLESGFPENGLGEGNHMPATSSGPSGGFSASTDPRLPDGVLTGIGRTGAHITEDDVRKAVQQISALPEGEEKNFQLKKLAFNVNNSPDRDKFVQGIYRDAEKGKPNPDLEKARRGITSYVEDLVPKCDAKGKTD